MFENLSDKLQNALQKLKGKGKLTEKDIDLAMKEVKLSLLEADVNFKVVKLFINNVKERALGAEVMESLTPGQHVVKIVHEELVKIMGQGSESRLKINSNDITYIMMCGLQGAGKTTATGKLANRFKKDGKRPLLVACDIYRPAAIKQLQVVGESVGVPVFEMGDKINPVTIAKEAMKHAMKHGHDIVIIDTAGRLHIDEELMDELVQIKQTVEPEEILLVLDAMTGQDAVNVAETFNEKIGITGVILTKLDGDTRGGAALSIRSVTGKPILYIGMGEKLSDLEQFYPDRMASRILGMGDVLTLIDKVQSQMDEEKAKELERKIKKAEFDFDDYLEQMQQMKNMGGMQKLMEMLPGGLCGLGSKANLKDVDWNEGDKAIKQMEAIIHSMTKEERRNPDLLSPPRKKRIAMGAGVDISEVNRVVKQFGQTRKMMKQFSGMMGGKGKKRFKLPFGL